MNEPVHPRDRVFHDPHYPLTERLSVALRFCRDWHSRAGTTETLIHDGVNLGEAFEYDIYLAVYNALEGVYRDETS